MTNQVKRTIAIAAVACSLASVSPARSQTIEQKSYNYGIIVSSCVWNAVGQLTDSALQTEVDRLASKDPVVRRFVMDKFQEVAKNGTHAKESAAHCLSLMRKAIHGKQGGV